MWLSRKVLVTIISLTAAAVLAILQPWLPRVVVGEVRINPRVHIDAEQQYRVVVWDYELPLPTGTTTHGEAIRNAAAAFTKAHPNITIDVVIKPWDDAVSLPDALAAGTPPDVAGLPDGARLISAQLQVPLEHFFSKESAADLYPAARAAATAYGHMWAWPRYIDPAKWAVYMPMWQKSCQTLSPQSCRSDGYIAPLTTTAWTAILTECRTKSGGCGIAANVLDTRFYYELTAGMTGTTLLNEDGDIAWKEDDVRNSAALIREWVTRGFLAADIQSAARTRLGRFWSGRNLALAPTTSLLWYHLWQHSGVLVSPDANPANQNSGIGSTGRLEEAEHPVTWVTPPTGDHITTVAHVPGYAVFRQTKYQGDEQTKAAAMVAEHLSRQVGSWEATTLFGVPAHPSAVPEWQEESRLPTPVLQALLDACVAYTVVTPPADDRLLLAEQRLLADSLLPGLLSVLQGNITAEEFAHDFVSLPAMAVSEAATP